VERLCIVFRTLVIEGGVFSLAVIEDFDVVKEALPGRDHGGIVGMIDQFRLQGFEEALGHGVIIAIAGPAHALHHLVRGELGPERLRGILHAPVRVQHQMVLRPFLLPGLFEGDQRGVLGLQGSTEGPADHFPVPEIQDDREILPAGLRLDVGDIGHPDPMRGSHGELLL